MTNRIVEALGVDPIQWRALVRTYLRMDFRGGGGATTRSGTGRSRGHPLVGVAIITGLGGAMFAMLAMRIPDLLVSAALLTTYGGINTVMIPAADEVEALVVRQLGATALFAAKFREAAARALLLPKRRPGGRSPLWQQRKRAADLLSVASKYGSFPME